LINSAPGQVHGGARAITGADRGVGRRPTQSQRLVAEVPALRDALSVLRRRQAPAGRRAPEEQLHRVTLAALVGHDGQPGHLEHPFERHQ